MFVLFRDQMIVLLFIKRSKLTINQSELERERTNNEVRVKLRKETSREMWTEYSNQKSINYTVIQKNWGQFFESYS